MGNTPDQQQQTQTEEAKAKLPQPEKGSKLNVEMITRRSDNWAAASWASLPAWRERQTWLSSKLPFIINNKDVEEEEEEVSEEESRQRSLLERELANRLQQLEMTSGKARKFKSKSDSRGTKADGRESSQKVDGLIRRLALTLPGVDRLLAARINRRSTQQK